VLGYLIITNKVVQMKTFTKNHAKIFGGICLLLIAIAAACTLKIEVAKPEIKVVIQLPDGGSIVQVGDINITSPDVEGGTNLLDAGIN